MSVEQDFKQAADDISNKINKTMTDEELKEIYALYKQVSCGGFLKISIPIGIPTYARHENRFPC